MKIIWYWGLGEFPNPFLPASVATSLLVYTATVVVRLLAFNNTLKLERCVWGGVIGLRKVKMPLTSFLLRFSHCFLTKNCSDYWNPLFNFDSMKTLILTVFPRLLIAIIEKQIFCKSLRSFWKFGSFPAFFAFVLAGYIIKNFFGFILFVSLLKSVLEDCM